MSKQELLSWTSLGVSISLMVMYILFFIGWPDFLPDYSDLLVRFFINIFWVALAIEIFIGISESNTKIDKDERDILVEAFSYRYSYNFLMIVLVVILSNSFLRSVFGEQLEVYSILANQAMLFHVLLLTLFSASIIRRSTMIFHYRKTY